MEEVEVQLSFGAVQVKKKFRLICDVGFELEGKVIIPPKLRVIVTRASSSSRKKIQSISRPNAKVKREGGEKSIQSTGRI